MVKFVCRTILACVCASLITSCEIDVLGLFNSEELENRLESANDFKYIDEHSARTIPALGADFNFIFLTDTHISETNNGELPHLKAHIRDAKFLVYGGDITQSGARGELEDFIRINSEIESELGVPCYPVIGNHDIYFGNWTVWRDLIGSTRYRIDSADNKVTLLVLDSANAFFGNEQLDWLSTQLNNCHAENIFVFSHATLFYTDNLFADTQSITDRREKARFISLMSSSQRTRAYLAGHSHLYTDRQIGGKRYISSDDFLSHHSFIRIHVSAAGISYTRESF